MSGQRGRLSRPPDDGCRIIPAAPPEQDYEGLREETGAKTDGAAHAHDETRRKAPCRTFNTLTIKPYAKPHKIAQRRLQAFLAGVGYIPERVRYNPGQNPTRHAET